MSKINSDKVSIIMGSQSDFKTMKLCQKVLKILKVKFETKIVSAHRTPDRMYQFAKNAEKNKHTTMRTICVSMVFIIY